MHIAIFSSLRAQSGEITNARAIGVLVNYFKTGHTWVFDGLE